LFAVNALMGSEERQLLAASGVRAVVERFVARQPQAFWSQHAMLVRPRFGLVATGRRRPSCTMLPAAPLPGLLSPRVPGPSWIASAVGPTCVGFDTFGPSKHIHAFPRTHLTAQPPLLPSSPPPTTTALQVQLGDKLALVREGRVVHVLATASSSLFPRLAALRPLAAAPDARGACQVALWGHNLDNEEDVLLARCNGEACRGRRLGGGWQSSPHGRLDGDASTTAGWGAWQDAFGICCGQTGSQPGSLGPQSGTSRCLAPPFSPAQPRRSSTLHSLMPQPPSTPGAYVEVERLSLEQDPAWDGLQKLNLRLAGLPAGGALQLEVMRGAYLSGAKVCMGGSLLRALCL
jgi:hypothetical protein